MEPLQFYLTKDGQSSGPYPAEQLREMLAAGMIAGSDFAWHEGLDDWAPIEGLLAAVARAVAEPAPVPVPAKPAPAKTAEVRPAMAARAPARAAVARPPKPASARPVSLSFAPVVLAGRKARFFAHLIDLSLGAAALGLPLGGVLAARFLGYAGNRTDIIGGAVAAILVLALAGVQMRLLTLRGQTLGKRSLGLKIVTVAGNATPGFVNAVLLRSVVMAIINAAMFGGLVDKLLIFREDRRCLHDLLAGTKVVNA